MLMAFNAGFGGSGCRFQWVVSRKTQAQHPFGPTSGNPLHTPAALGFLLMGFCTSSVWVIVQHKLWFVVLN